MFLLHGPRRVGGAALVRGGHNWHERLVPLAELADNARLLAGSADVYLSQQSFFGYRRIAQLAALGAAYVDLDFHTTDYRQFASDWVAGLVLRTLEAARLPAPSLILTTGRGLLCIWLHDHVPRAALPRWQALQRVLADALSPFGADRLALDAARVFRLSGTINSKSGSPVRPVWSAGPIHSLWRWDFDALAREVLPIERAELHSLTAARAAKRADATFSRSPTIRLTRATYMETVLSDLQRIRRHRWFGGLPAGQRDAWLFVAASAMAYLAPAPVLQREMTSLAQEVGGWTSKECNSRLSAVYRRAFAHSRGETIEWQGQQVTPLYRFRADTIVDWLQITPTEMREAGLRVLLDRDVQREHEAERQRQSRAAHGGPGLTMADYNRARSTAAADRAALAQALSAQGQTQQQIAQELGIGQQAVGRLLKRKI